METQEITIRVPSEAEISERRKQSEKGWQIFSTFGDDADEGCLENASEKHDLYLYGKQ